MLEQSRFHVTRTFGMLASKIDYEVNIPSKYNNESLQLKKNVHQYAEQFLERKLKIFRREIFLSYFFFAEKGYLKLKNELLNIT